MICLAASPCATAGTETRHTASQALIPVLRADNRHNVAQCKTISKQALVKLPHQRRVAKWTTTAIASGGRQWTLTDARCQVRDDAALAARTMTWLRDEEASISAARMTPA
jgi:hypothetical protein